MANGVSEVMDLLVERLDTGRPIKALSLWEPWASLLAVGLKRHETRHWPTKVRGLVAIHAAKKCDAAGAPTALCRWAFGWDWARTRPQGRVIALGVLTACHRTDDIADRVSTPDYYSGNFAPGRFAFEFSEVRPLFKTAPTVGRQGFFDWLPPYDLALSLGPPADQEGEGRRFCAEKGIAYERS